MSCPKTMIDGPCDGVRDDGGCAGGDVSAPAAPGEELRVAAALALVGSALGGGG